MRLHDDGAWMTHRLGLALAFALVALAGFELGLMHDHFAWIVVSFVLFHGGLFLSLVFLAAALVGRYGRGFVDIFISRGW